MIICMLSIFILYTVKINRTQSTSIKKTRLVTTKVMPPATLLSILNADIRFPVHVTSTLLSSLPRLPTILWLVPAATTVLGIIPEEQPPTGPACYSPIRCCHCRCEFPLPHQCIVWRPCVGLIIPILNTPMLSLTCVDLASSSRVNFIGGRIYATVPPFLLILSRL